MSPSPAGIMPKVELNRTERRLVKHHLPLFVLSAATIASLYFTRPYRDVLSRASFATAYPALALIALTLFIGPMNLIRKRQNPMSSDVRRDLGIWAGILSILHSLIGQNVHMRGRPWLYYVYGQREHHDFPMRHDLFGLANYTGAVSALVLIALLATSNDYSLRAFGNPRWKQLQRWNYAAFAVAAIHSIAYQVIEKQSLPFVSAVIGCIAITIVVQIAGIMRRNSNAARRSSPSIAESQSTSDYRDGTKAH
jgi:sulfoxide reductase heme-binding subunit YedZ